MTRPRLKQSSKQTVGAALIAAAVAIMLPIPAHATVPVIDFANLTQNVLTAARTLEEVDNQVTQIQQGISMLENEARNLTSLPFSVLAELQSSMGQIDQLYLCGAGMHPWGEVSGAPGHNAAHAILADLEHRAEQG